MFDGNWPPKSVRTVFLSPFVRVCLKNRKVRLTGRLISHRLEKLVREKQPARVFQTRFEALSISWFRVPSKII